MEKFKSKSVQMQMKLRMKLVATMKELKKPNIQVSRLMEEANVKKDSLA